MPNEYIVVFTKDLSGKLGTKQNLYKILHSGSIICSWQLTLCTLQADLGLSTRYLAIRYFEIKL